MNADRFKFAACALLAASVLTAGAQQSPRPALGSRALARQRSARFLAERGIAATPGNSPRYNRGPAQMLAEARAQYRRLSQQSSSPSGAQVPSWQPVGPAQVNTSAYGAVTGRVISIAADPSDSSGNTVYVGTASGGVWKSTNAAGDPSSVTLVPLTDTVYSSLSQTTSAPSLSIGAVSVQPVAPGATPVLLAGTGDPNDTTASYFGSGILRSTNGGAQWTLISQSSDQLAGASANYSFQGNGFAGFAWGTVSGNPVVVAAVSQAAEGVQVNAVGGMQSVLGIYYSTDQGQTWLMATITDPNGTVQSAQTSFTPCLANGSPLPCGNAVTSIVWNPVRHEFLAAVRFHGYYSSPDGQNWTRLASQPGANLTALACPPNLGYPGSQACPIYNGVLAVQPVTGDTFVLTTDINNLDQGLFQDSCRLTSGSCASSTLSFTQVPDTALDAGALNPAQPTLIPQADYDLYLAAVPSKQGSQPDTLLFAGTADIYRCDLGAGCAWRNTTHAQSSDCNSAHVAPAQYAIDATFGASGLLYFGNDGGLWRSTDAVNQQQPQCSSDDANHYQNLNPGFTGSIAEVDDIAPNLSDPQSMMLSLGPLGTAAPLSGASSWQQVLNGEGDYAAIDPDNAQNWYATSEFGIGINLCTEGASCGIAAFGSPVIDSADVGSDGYGQIIPAPWILDPQNSSNLILGTCRVWRGPASGGAQTQLSAMLDGDNGSYCNGNAEVRSLAASGKPSDASGAPETIYAGMAGLYDGGATVAGHVFAQSVGSGPTPSSWTDLSYNLNGFNPNGFDVSSIYVDPHSPNGQTVYVALQGFGALHLYQSTNGGSIWQNISRGLPDAPVNNVIVDPNNANTVYVATDAGVYYTQNVASCGQLSSSCWSPFGASLPNVPVTKLVAVNGGSGSSLLAATDGRGVWQIALPDAAATTATVAPNALTFANQQLGTASAPQRLLITNTGSLPLQVNTINIAGDFTESDTCTGESIAPNDACIIEVSFVPTKTGADSGLLTLYGNLPDGGQITVPLSGTGIPGAAITLTPTALCFPATLIGQTTSASCNSSPVPQQVQSIVIANTGGAATTLASISITGDFAISANTCGKSLAPANSANDSCTVNITFTPTASGNRTGTLTVKDSLGTQTAQLVGTGESPSTDTLSPTPLTLNFGSQSVGVKSPGRQLTMTNTGDQPVEDIDLSLQSAHPDFIAVNNCGTTLAGHSSCAILVYFLPSIASAENGILTVSDVLASGAHQQQVVLTGTGVAPSGKVSILPAALDFGDLPLNQPSAPQTITVTNNGTSALTGIQSPVISGDAGDFAISANTCGTSLSANSTCTMSVTFAPTATGNRIGTLTVSAANLAVPLVVGLSGTGSATAFSMWVSGPASAVITSGQTASFTIDVNGPSGTATLSCNISPAGSAASCPNPPPVTLTGLSTGSVIISFTPPPQQARSAGPSWIKVATALAFLVPIGFLGRRRRGWAALAACVTLALLLPIGCGIHSSAGSGPTGGGGPSPASTQYVLTVTGSMGAATPPPVVLQVTVE